ncbi:hypothetical protein EV283_1039 [Sphingomonas sp. BK036]|nr:hypothetical protein EV283_1039 [Sphingomonas sp. BK036]
MGRNAMYFNPKHSVAFARTAPPLQPNYQDELTDDHASAIRKAADPDGKRAAARNPLYNPGW